MGRLIRIRRNGFIKRFKKEEDGATAVEFAFVGAPFIWMLMAIFETGLMLFAEYVVEDGTAQAARMIRTGQVQNQGMSQADFKNLVCGNLASFLSCDKLYVDVRTEDAFGDISAPPGVADGQISNDVSNNSQFDPGEPMQIVSVRVYYDWELFTPGITKLAQVAGTRRVLTAGAAFRNEPFAGN